MWSTDPGWMPIGTVRKISYCSIQYLWNTNKQCIGKDDFFFCHWYAESEDAIIEALEKVGFNDLIVTMPNEMQRYISIDKPTGKPIVNPFDED